MNGRHGGALIGSEFVDLGRGNFVIQLVYDFHRQLGVIDFDGI
jgi:hypothetical protein